MNFDSIRSKSLRDKFDHCGAVLAVSLEELRNGSGFSQLIPNLPGRHKFDLTKDVEQALHIVMGAMRFFDENSLASEPVQGEIRHDFGNNGANFYFNPHPPQLHHIQNMPPPPSGFPPAHLLQPQMIMPPPLFPFPPAHIQQHQIINVPPQPFPFTPVHHDQMQDSTVDNEIQNASDDAQDWDRGGDIDLGFDNESEPPEDPVSVTTEEFKDGDLQPLPDALVTDEDTQLSVRPSDVVSERFEVQNVTSGVLFKDHVKAWTGDVAAKFFKTGFVTRDLDCLLHWATIFYSFQKDQIFVVLRNDKHNFKRTTSALRTIVYGCFFCRKSFFNVKFFADDHYKLVVLQEEHICSFDQIHTTTKRHLQVADKAKNVGFNTTFLQPSSENDNNVDEVSTERTLNPAELMVSQGVKRRRCDSDMVLGTLDRIKRETESIDVAKSYLILSGARSLFNSIITKISIELFQELKKVETFTRTTEFQTNEHMGKTITEFLMAILGLNNVDLLAEVNKYLNKGTSTTAIYSRFRDSVGYNLRNDPTFSLPRKVRDEDIYSILITFNSLPSVKSAVFTVNQEVITTDSISDSEISKLKSIKMNSDFQDEEAKDGHSDVDFDDDVVADVVASGEAEEDLEENTGDEQALGESECSEDIDGVFTKVQLRELLHSETKYQTDREFKRSLGDADERLKDEAIRLIGSYPQTRTEQIYFQMACPFSTEYLLPLVIIDSVLVKEYDDDESSKFSDLLVATMLTPDHVSVVIGYLLCDGESVTNYKLFIKTLQVMNPQFNFAEMSVVTDNNEAIKTSVRGEFRSHVQCYIHLVRNITKLLSGKNAKEVKSLFHTLSQTLSKEEFDNAEKQLKQLLETINKHKSKGTFATIQNTDTYARLKRENAFDVWTSNSVESINLKLKKARRKNLVSLLTNCLDLQYKTNLEEIQKHSMLKHQPIMKPLVIVNFKLACLNLFKVQQDLTNNQLVKVVFREDSTLNMIKDLYRCYSKLVKSEKSMYFRSPWLRSITNNSANLEISSEKATFSSRNTSELTIPTDIKCDVCPYYGETGVCVHSTVYLASILLPQIKIKLPSLESILDNSFDLCHLIEKEIGSRAMDKIFGLSHFRYDSDRNLVLEEHGLDSYAIPETKDILTAYNRIKKTLPKT